jgi:hypothetical protein
MIVIEPLTQSAVRGRGCGLRRMFRNQLEKVRICNSITRNGAAALHIWHGNPASRWQTNFLKASQGLSLIH